MSLPSRLASLFAVLALVAAFAPGAAAQTTLLDPNAATRPQLLALPGVTAAIADALVRGRPYADNVAVDRVLVAGGLTEEQRDAVYARLWKPLDLNAATDVEILLIPGIGNRMLREFREYRPYRTLAQFSREMGKYVDDAEVKRLEQYVRVPPPAQ